MDVSSLFDDSLRALCDPDGGSRFYQLHAPSAAIRNGDGVRAAAELDASEFAAAHRENSLRGQDSLPLFRRETLLAQSADKSVAWFQVTEVRGELSVPVAVGFEGSTIAWCSVSPQVKRWSYRDGLLQ